MFQARNLTKRYGRLTALSDVSFTVRPGEVLGLIGPNGAGKTTLFECLGGVLPLDAGSLRARRPADDRPRARASHALLPARRDRAVAGADGALGARLHARASSAAARDLRDEVVAAARPRRRCSTSPIGTLSKGQRKRALLAIGLLTPQPVLLADEPFDGLDLRQSREVGGDAARARGGGRTLFLSIHQISDAARVCDRFVLLSGGRVCGEGTLDELAALAAARDATGGRTAISKRCSLRSRSGRAVRRGCSRKEWRELWRRAPGG